MTEMPQVDPRKCNGCGLCLEVCACGALFMTNKRIAVTETEHCHWCTECEAVCPTGAISCAYEIVIEEGESRTRRPLIAPRLRSFHPPK